MKIEKGEEDSFGVEEEKRAECTSLDLFECKTGREQEQKSKNKIIFFLRYNDVALFVVILVVEVTGLALLFLTCFFR